MKCHEAARRRVIARPHRRVWLERPRPPKARLQGLLVPNQVCFPPEKGEQFRKRAIANMVPPPFAKALCLAACESIKHRIQESEFIRRVALLMSLDDDDDGVPETDTAAGRRVATAVRRVGPSADGMRMSMDLPVGGIHGEWEHDPRCGWAPKGTCWNTWEARLQPR